MRERRYRGVKGSKGVNNEKASKRGRERGESEHMKVRGREE